MVGAAPGNEGKSSPVARQRRQRRQGAFHGTSSFSMRHMICLKWWYKDVMLGLKARCLLRVPNVESHSWFGVWIDGDL